MTKYKEGDILPDFWSCESPERTVLQLRFLQGKSPIEHKRTKSCLPTSSKARNEMQVYENESPKEKIITALR